MATKTKKVVPNRSEYEDFIVDLGNSDLKSMRGAMPHTKRRDPHAVRIMDEAELRDFQGRLKGGLARGASGSIFTVDYKGSKASPAFKHSYIVGEMAQSGQMIRRSGVEKYSRDYYAALLISQLLAHYPNGCENLRVMAMFPPADFRAKTILMQSLGGTHTVTKLNGEVVVYKVLRVETTDEPIGGLCNYVMANDGISYKERGIRVNDTLLTIDIGGRISSMALASLKYGVDYSNIVSEDLGIQDVMNDMSKFILSNPEFERYFSSHRGSLPHDEKMRYALMHGQYSVRGGYELDVLNELADATAKICLRIRSLFTQHFNGGTSIDHIIITGGGGALLFNQLCNTALDFNPDRIYKSHDIVDEMHFANMLGADKVLTSIVQQEA